MVYGWCKDISWQAVMKESEKKPLVLNGYNKHHLSRDICTRLPGCLLTSLPYIA